MRLRTALSPIWASMIGAVTSTSGSSWKTTVPSGTARTSPVKRRPPRKSRKSASKGPRGGRERVGGPGARGAGGARRRACREVFACPRPRSGFALRPSPPCYQEQRDHDRADEEPEGPEGGKAPKHAEEHQEEGDTRGAADEPGADHVVHR